MKNDYSEYVCKINIVQVSSCLPSSLIDLVPYERRTDETSIYQSAREDTNGSKLE